MAVEIPVIVDIEQAFKDAAKRVPQAIEPLEKQISKKTLNVKVDVGTAKHPQLRKFKDLLNESQSSATELERAISAVNKQVRAMQKAGGFKAGKDLKTSERDLIALRAALETKLESGSFIDSAVDKVKAVATGASSAEKSATTAIRNTNNGLRTQEGLLGKIMGRLSAYTAIFAGLRLIRNVRETTAEFEMQRVALGGIIQDATKANQLFGQIKAAAVESPFEIKDLVSFTKQLSAYRIETDRLFDVTMRLADVSAGLGVDMSRLVLAYGQVRAASVLRGQELRQFTEAGIPLVDLLAKKFTQLRGEMVSTGEVFKLISERAVPFAMIEEIFNDMTSAGGIFYQMQLKQSETLKGQWMKLKDVISIAYDEMGRTALVNQAMTGWIHLISNLVKSWERIASVVNVAIYSYLAYQAAVKRLIPFYNMQQRSIERQIKLEKQQQIEQIKLASKTDQLTKADQRRIAQIKKMTAEDLKRIYAMDKMSQSQAMMFYWRNKDNKEVVKAITQTGILTKTQMNAIKNMNTWQIHLKTWGSSIRTFFKTVGTAISSFWPIAAVSALVTVITSLIQKNKEQEEAIRKVDKAYSEQEQNLLSIENAYRKIQKAIMDVADEQSRAAKEAASFGEKLAYAQKIVEALKKFGLGGDFDLSLLNTGNIDDFVDAWLKQLNEANELTRDWGRNLAQVANAWEASILGIHFAGDNLNTDIKQLTSAFVKLTSDKGYRSNVDSMRNYVEQLEVQYKGHYDLLSIALGEEAKLAIASKRRNESEYQYQMRLIKNYEKIRQYAQSDRFMLSGAMKSFKSMSDALTNFEVKLSEVEREFDKTWGAMEGKDEITIKMAIDKMFAENQWEDWLKEAWIERVNGKYQMSIQMTPTIAQVNVPKGMKGIIATEFAGLFTEQELENMSSVSEIGKAIEGKMKNAASAIAEADKQANNLANSDLWAAQTKEKIQRAQLTIDAELAKEEKDRNQDAINEAIALIDALTRQNTVYDEQIQKKKESAKAEYELAKAAKERLLNENLSLMAQDIQKTFPELVAGEDIIDKMNLQKIGEAIQNLFPDASADLLARPLVDAAELVKKGWEEAGEGIATVYSSSFDYEDETGKHNILVTPILPDGSVLSPEELDEYIDELLSRGGDLREIDSKKLILGIDVQEDAGERLHELQEEYYALQEQVKNTAKRFLITDEDLLKIKDGVDAYDVWAKNMKAIADEREKMEGAGVDELIVAEEQMKLDAERIAIEAQLADIEKQIADWNYEEAKAQYDNLRLAVQQATTKNARLKAEADLAKFVEATNFDERAILVIERQRLETQLGITNAALGAKNAILNTFSAMDEAEDFWKEFGKRYNFTLKDKPTGGRGQDPWIILIKNRMKFMQDFQKGYDDLSRYLSSDVALAKESDIMEKRGLSLGINPSEQKRAATELSQWYQEARERVFKEAEKYGATGSVESFLSKEIKETKKNGKVLKDFQNLLQSLWDAQADLDVSDAKKKLEQAISKLKDELKRSEAAKNFYNDILGLTGDQELAANMAVSVYGDPGKELGERIRQSIADALNAPVGEGPSVTAAQRSAIENAAKNLDFREVLKEVDQYPDHVRDAVKEAADIVEKYNSDIAKSYTKLLTQFDEITTKRKTIEKKAAEDIATIRKGLAMELIGIDKNVAEEQRVAAADAANARADAAIEAIERQKELDLLRTSRDYRLFFETIGTISLASARKVAKAERKIITEQFEAGEISLSKFRRELDRIDEQLEKYQQVQNPFVTYLTKGLDGLFDKFKEYGRSLDGIAGNIEDDEGFFDINKDTMDYIDRLGKLFGGELFGVSGRKNVFAQMMEKYGPNTDDWKKALDEAGEKLSSMSADMAQGLGWANFWVSFAGGSIKAFDQIAQKSKNTEGEVKEGWNKVAKFIITSAAGMLVGAPITAGLAGQMWDVDDAWERFTGLNEKAMSGFEKFKQGDLIGALIDNIEGWAEVFGINTKKIDRQIKQQSNLIEDLQYEYSRLDVAIQKAFGSDYIANYNQQISVLQAQAEAYRKQAELERSKEKKADEDTAKGYEKSARDVEDQIADMQSQLSEFFTGTDLTSAAKDFAEAWIEAYKEFGSTTDAMSEKFNDMIENMVVNSLAAQLIQGILKPIFDQIDTAAKDGALSAEDIASISALVPDAMAQIDAGMTGLMSQLTAAGVNLRQQAGQFTGISRDIASASEESITGLAAGINTQNFYMQHIDQNVALILSALTGGTTTGQASVTGQVADPYKDEMLKKVSCLPTIDENLAALLTEVRRVIKPRNAKPDYVLHTNL